MPAPLSASFISSAPTKGWVSHFEYEPEDEKRVVTKGKLFALISLASSSDKQALLSRTIFTRLSENYYLGSADPRQSLEAAFNDAIQILGEGQLVVAVFLEKTMVGAGFGGA